MKIHKFDKINILQCPKLTSILAYFIVEAELFRRYKFVAKGSHKNDDLISKKN